MVEQAQLGGFLPGDAPDHHDYAHRERSVDVSRRRAARASARDVEVPAPVDLRRRVDAERDPLTWLPLYLPHLFYKPFSAAQREFITEASRIMQQGGRKANAECRGGGKTTIMRGLQLWAVLSGIVRFCPLISKNQGEASDKLEEQKTLLQGDGPLADDYPEVCAFARAVGGTPARAKGMLYEGEPVHFRWLPASIILPYVPQLPWARSNSSVLMARGIEGQIRGITHTTPDGDVLRPDFILIDDPQDSAIASSAMQVQKTLQVIARDVMGTRGHGEKVSAVANVTVVRQNDVADQLVNRELNPQWNGRRVALMPEMPERLDLWQAYESIIWRAVHDPEDTTTEPNNCAAARAFYEAHRAEMDRGCVVTNEHIHLGRSGESECASAIQYCMNLRIQSGADAFEAEYNNNPSSVGALPLLALSPHMVMSRANGIPRGTAPEGHDRLMVGLDVGKGTLWMVAIAFSEQGRRGHILDYGSWEVAPVDADARTRDTAAYQALDIAVYQALVSVRTRLEMQPYLRADGSPLPVDVAAVDVGFMPDAVNRACDERKHWFSMKGYGRKDLPRPGRDVIVSQFLYARRNGIGGRWRHYQDADAHKRFVHEGFRVPAGQPGSLTVFGDLPTAHREFAGHVCAEVYVETGPGEYRWEIREAGAPNHWLDAAALCYAAASRRQLSVFDAYAVTTTDVADAAAPPAVEQPSLPTIPKPKQALRVRVAQTLDL
ncbi:MAG: terminase gpA endonuclease subunit [Planctomycetota bacterium]